MKTEQFLPQQTSSNRPGRTPQAHQRDANLTCVSFAIGTEGSNPTPSSGESAANLRPAASGKRFSSVSSGRLAPPKSAIRQRITLLQHYLHQQANGRQIAVAMRSTLCTTVILHSKPCMSRNYNDFMFAGKYLHGGTSLFQFSCDGWLDERNHHPGVLRPPTRFRRPTAPVFSR